MLAYDFVNTFVLLAILALVGVAYSVKLILKGRTQYDRVNRQGGSVLMGRGMMEIGYSPQSACLSPCSMTWKLLRRVVAACLAAPRQLCSSHVLSAI